MLRTFAIPMMVLLCTGLAHAKPEFVAVEFCEGVFGPKRTGTEFSVMGEFCVRYRATGVTTDAEGQQDLTLGISIRNAAGVVVDSGSHNGKGKGFGGLVTGHWSKGIPAFVAPGKYVVRLSVRDNLTSVEAVSEHPVTFKALEFAVDSPRMFFDPEMKIPGSSQLVTNQGVVVAARLLGYDCSQGKCHAVLKWHLLDDKGKLIRILGEDTYKEDDARVLSAQVPGRGYFRSVAIERPGNFFVELVAQDKMANKVASLQIPITVREP